MANVNREPLAALAVMTKDAAGTQHARRTAGQGTALSARHGARLKCVTFLLLRGGQLRSILNTISNE